MNTARQTKSEPRTRTVANIHDLEALVGKINPQLRGTGNLKSRAKRSYYWFAELAAQGFESVRAPMGAHAHLQWLTFCGESKSVRTIQRAFKELEEAGYIRRRRCNRGDVATIDIIVEKFDFYIKRNHRFKVVPCGTFTHKSVHTTSCHPDEFTNSSVYIPTPSDPKVVTTSKKSKIHTKKTFSEWWPAVAFTIGVICKGMGRSQQTYWRDMAAKAIAENVDPFAYWNDERWRAMPHGVREREARALMPELRSWAARHNSPPSSPPSLAPPVFQKQRSPSSVDPIDEQWEKYKGTMGKNEFLTLYWASNNKNRN